MTIVLNGKEVELEAEHTVEQILRQMTERDDLRGIAVARNRRVVPRSLWASMVVADGDELELVGVMQGG